MSAPGTRYFIGPLTPAQQRQRDRARRRYSEISEIQYSRNISFREALEVMKWEWEHRFAPLFPERQPYFAL